MITRCVHVEFQLKCLGKTLFEIVINFEFGITDGKVFTNMRGGSREKARTHKLQIIAQARLPQVTTSARKLPVGKQLNLALTKQRLLTEHRS